MHPFPAPMLMGAGARRIRTTTWSPADKQADVNLSNGNLTATGVTAFPPANCVRATGSVSGGKYVFSASVEAAGAQYPGLGLSSAGAELNNNLHAMGAFSYWSATGQIVISAPVATVAAAPVGSSVDLAVDFGAKRLWVRVNGGAWNNSGATDPARGLGGVDLSSSLGPGPWFPTAQVDGLAKTTLNCFPASAPAGFLPWDGAY